MTELELGNILRQMYDSAKPKEQAVMIHLFSIKYAKEISQPGISKKEIVRIARLPDSYVSEINKGVNLAKYVIPNNYK